MPAPCATGLTSCSLSRRRTCARLWPTGREGIASSSSDLRRLTLAAQPSNKAKGAKHESEAMDEELIESDVPTVGERLRAAREEKGLSLEDIAAQTRIPRRHLESIETAEWDALPAPTYTTGFAKSY